MIPPGGDGSMLGSPRAVIFAATEVGVKAVMKNPDAGCCTSQAAAESW